jgi:hypothetical protein
MKTISFEIQPDGDVYYISCEAMKFSSYTNDPKKLIKELFEEWFDADMGEAFLPV